MTNISKAVWKHIDVDPVLRKGLAKGIVNKRALALYLQAAGIKAPTHAIISAIRRYETSGQESVFEDALSKISGSIVSSRSGIVSISVEKDATIGGVLSRLFSAVNFNKNEVLRISQANEGIKLIIDEKNLQKAKDALASHKIRKIERKIAEINIHLDAKSWESPGVVASITSELASHGVNIVEIMSCMPELLIFIREKDLLSAHSAIYCMIRKEDKDG